MKLEEARMKLPAYLRGALTPEESAAVEQALAREPISPAEQQRLEQVDGMLRAAPLPEPPPTYFKDLAARIQSKVTGVAAAPVQERSMSSNKEDSGLIDVKQLAAQSVAPAEENAPNVAMSEFSQLSGRASVVGMQIAPLPPEPVQSPFNMNMSAPMASPMMPPPQARAPKWVWPLFGLVGITAAGAIAVAVFALKDKPAAPVVAVNEPPAVTAPAAPTVTPIPTPTPAAAPVPTRAEPAAPPPEVAKVAAPEAEVADAPAAPSGKGGKAARGKAGKGTKVAAVSAPAPKADAKAAAVEKVVAKATAAPAPVEEKKAEAPKPKGKGAELDSLLASALSPGKARDDEDEAPKPKKEVKAEAPKPAVDPMKVALDGLKPRAKKCFAKFNIPGMVNVRLTVGGNGSVQSLTLSGDYDGTPTGSCLVKELKGASFPATGSTKSLSHSFKLP